MANNISANYTLYKHTFPNGKVYIGITKQKPEVRWGKDGLNYKNNVLMWNAIQKYGWENVKHEILNTNLTEDLANELEVSTIKKYNATDRQYGYNIWPGGLVCSGWRHSEASKIKMSIASKNADYSNRRTTKGNHYGRTIIYQYDLLGNFINSYKGYWEASKAIDIPSQGISDCVNNRCKTYYGYTFSKEFLNKEEVLSKIKYNYGRTKIYCYNNTGKLIYTFSSYRAAVKVFPSINENNLSDNLNGRLKTYLGYVFSKVELTNQKVLDRYKAKPRKSKYKIILTDKNTKEKTVYYNVEDLAKNLNVKASVLRNVINGAKSKLHEKYIFEKELNNEN